MKKLIISTASLLILQMGLLPSANATGFAQRIVEVWKSQPQNQRNYETCTISSNHIVEMTDLACNIIAIFQGLSGNKNFSVKNCKESYDQGSVYRQIDDYCSTNPYN